MADLTGTFGNDILFLQGGVQHLTLSFTNPYSGLSYFIDDEYNTNLISYDGLGGNDILFMTNIGDALFVRDLNTGVQTIYNMEIIFAGNGGDVVILADAEYVLGSMIIEGGAADDLILANSGDDTIRGQQGNDILDGGPGNDLIYGGTGNGNNSGNDWLSGGAGADHLIAEDGDDILQYFADGTYTGAYLAMNIGSPDVEGPGTYAVLKNKNYSLDIFNGGTGFDTLVMTDGNDVLFLENPHLEFHSSGSSLRLISIEKIEAGAGNDVIDLTHDVLTYGDIIVDGGDGNDYIWTSVGNDTLYGGNGNDNIWGDAGNDVIYGGNGNDIIYGGPSMAANPHLVISINNEHNFSESGQFNIDFSKGALGLFDDSGWTLNGHIVELLDKHPQKNGVPPGLAAQKEKYDILGETLGVEDGFGTDFATTVTVSFVSREAAFANTLGAYTIDADGTIRDAHFAFANSHDLSGGETHSFDVSGAFGFFLIANGYAENNSYTGFDFSAAALQFIYDFGGTNERSAKITDDGDMITLVYDNGGGFQVLNGHVYHTTERGEQVFLNSDNMTHVVSGLAGEGSDALRVAFEDLHHLGDADFNDFIFDVTVADQIVNEALIDDSDILFGGAGNDIIYGGIGDDILIGGEGSDTLYGDQGADTFLFQKIADAGDMIMDFSITDGDIINITDVLEGFDAGLDDVNDFMRLVNSGGNDVLEVNADGQGGDFVALAAFAGGLGGVGLADLIANGNLVVDQSVPV